MRPLNKYGLILMDGFSDSTHQSTASIRSVGGHPDTGVSYR